jgi:hypothetical protein
MSHSLQFDDHGGDPAGSDQQNPFRQPADDIVSQLPPRQQLFREHGIFGVDETDATVEFHRKSWTQV